jgi:hypothetical protein
MRNAISVVCLAVAGMVPIGCDKKLVITQVPTFYTADLKVIAIAPFRNQTQWRGANEIIADQVAAGLMANGTYKVFNRNDLKTVMDESDLNIALGADPVAAQGQLKKLTEVQAILVGTVTTYATTTNSQQKQDPVYTYDKKGNAHLSGYRTYVQTRNEANVTVTANLIRVSDGSTIYATPEPVWARVWAEGSPPTKDGQACASEAATSVASQLVATFAPTRREIKVDEGKALRTASELYDNKWTYQDTFSATNEKMFVVLALPGSCDRNRFRITIVRKDERQDLAEQDITWDKKHGGFGYLFNPKDIAAKGGGAGEYEIKFYSGAEPIMRRKFKIR